MPGGSFADNMLLAYLLQGATATRVTAWSAGLSTLAAPVDGTLGEFVDASYTRQSVVFAASVANTYTNTAAIVFGSMQTAKMGSSFLLFNNAGSYLCGGSLSANSTFRGGGTDSATFAAGAIRVVLS